MPSPPKNPPNFSEKNTSKLTKIEKQKIVDDLGMIDLCDDDFSDPILDFEENNENENENEIKKDDEREPSMEFGDSLSDSIFDDNFDEQALLKAHAEQSMQKASFFFSFECENRL